MLAAAVHDTWWVVVAFAGGTMPLLGIHLGHGGGFGFLWLIFALPVEVTIDYWGFVLVAVAVGGLARLVLRVRSEVAVSVAGDVAIVVLVALGAFGSLIAFASQTGT